MTRTAQADADITEIDSYLSRHSTAAADRVLDGIDQTAQQLARFPKLGRQRGDLGSGLRSYATPDGYIIYYLVSRNGIEVQRVLHGARHVDPSMS